MRSISLVVVLGFLALEARGQIVYWTAVEDESYQGFPHVERANVDGSNSVVLLVGTGNPKDIALDLSAGKVYLIEAGSRIRRMNTDGTESELILTGLDSPNGIVVDPGRRRIYWAESGDAQLGVTPKIQRAKLDGSEIEDIVTGLQKPVGVALVPHLGKIYWTDRDSENGKIQRADLDGSNVEDILTDLRDPGGIAIDLCAGKIYWHARAPSGAGGNLGIFRANLNGTDVQNLALLVAETRIALDPQEGKLYWTRRFEQEIGRADLDGTNVEVLPIDTMGDPIGIAIEPKSSPTCIPTVCGDGVVAPEAGEECDDAGESPSCDVDCTVAVCGDGTLNQTAGEECDDGNRDDSDFCLSTCVSNPDLVPDVITGDVSNLFQMAREGPVGLGTVGLGVSTTMCNKGALPVPVHPFPDTNHPVIVANLYRLSSVDGGDRLEQIGQAWLKHTFGSDCRDSCGFGCDQTDFVCDGETLAPGCGDAYAAFQFEPCGFGFGALMAPREVVNPYTGAMPAGADLGPGGGCDQNYPAANHIGHDHVFDPKLDFSTGISHRLQVQDVDLMPELNPGARYFVEGQYIVPEEFTRANGTQNNNVGHNELEVSGPDEDGVFTFTHPGETVSESPAIDAWSQAQQTLLEPAPLEDGRGFLAYKVRYLGDRLWHYEYALYNMNLDRAFHSFSLPLPADVPVSNIGFHAPPNHAPEANAETYPNDPWEVSFTQGAITWSTESFEDNPLADAVRYGTMFNFRFDADTPAESSTATIGLFKTGGDISAATVAPQPAGPTDCNGNGIDDVCDFDCAATGCNLLGCGESNDCNDNGIPDECDNDCNANGFADECDLADGTSDDCDGNGVPDECQSDCNGNGAADTCDIADGTSEDCNFNGVPDLCDLAADAGLDSDGDGMIDTCCPGTIVPPLAKGGMAGVATNRFIAFAASEPGSVQAVRITPSDLSGPFEALNGQPLWVAEPQEVSENSGVVLPSQAPGFPTFWAATLTCEAFYTDWSQYPSVQVFHEVVIPGASYDVQAINEGCGTTSDVNFSAPLSIDTSAFGNVAGPFDTGLGVWTEPEAEGAVDIVTDVISAIQKFSNVPGAPIKVRVDLDPETPDFKINIIDIVRILDAFRGLPYPFAPTTIEPCE